MKSIQTKISIRIGAIILLTSLIISFMVYNSAIKLVEDSMSEQAKSVAERAVKKINVEEYKQISPETGETDYYITLRNELAQMREDNGIKYLYTMGRRQKDDSYEYYYVVDGVKVGEDEATPIGEIEENYYPKIGKVFETGKIQVGEITLDKYGATISAYIPLKDKEGKIIGILGADCDAQRIYDLMNQTKIRIIIFTTITLIISLLFTFMISKKLIKPLKELTVTVNEVRYGDFTKKLEYQSDDEIGNLSDSFNHLITELQEMVHEIHYSSNDIVSAVTSLNENTVHTGEMGEQIAKAVNQIAENSAMLAQKAGKMLELMELSIHQLDEGVNQAALTVKNASKATLWSQEGSKSVSESIEHLDNITRTINYATDSIQKLNKRSEEVLKIIYVISKISHSTKLLALNASIESARAGEQGVGFSVVAEEIKKLSEQTNIQSKQIIELINNIQVETRATVNAMESNNETISKHVELVYQAGGALRNIVENVQNTEAEAKSMESKFRQLREDVNSLLDITNEVSNTIVESASVTEEIAASAEELSAAVIDNSKQTNKLQELSERLFNKIKDMKV